MSTSTERAYWRTADPLNVRTARTIRELDFNPQDWLSGPYRPRPTQRAPRRRVAQRVIAAVVLLALAMLAARALVAGVSGLVS